MKIAVCIKQVPTRDWQPRLNDVRLVRNGQMTKLNLRDGDTNAASMPIHSGDQLRVGRGTSLLRDVVGPFAAVLGALGVTITLLRQ